jgi:hypothetical protein
MASAITFTRMERILDQMEEYDAWLDRSDVPESEDEPD